MSVPMFLTALALAWILGRQAGVDGMALGLAAAMVLGLALWWVGRQAGARALMAAARARRARRRRGRGPPSRRRHRAGDGHRPGRAQVRAVHARRASPRFNSRGGPVFVYFTADWCVTCKVNEKGALEREQVAEAFADKQVAVLVGDWTRGDAAIGRFLEKHGRSGVPLYLYYAPGKPVEILPQVLTPSRLVSMVS